MLNLKKTKFQKLQKRRLKVKQPVSLFIQESSILRVKIVSLQSCRLTESQLESAYFAIRKKIKKGMNKVKILTFCDLPKTKKPDNVRMGNGKGNFSYWASNIKCGSSLFEIIGGSLKKTTEAMICGTKKLPIKIFTQVVKNK